MTEDINRLYDLKKGVHIELKESNKKIPDNLYETYSSFSNTDGGTIYLGIKEGKRNIITGVSNPLEQKKALISALHSKNKVSYCSVSDNDIQILKINGKSVIEFIVRKAPIQAKPVFIDGNLSKSYQRIGDGDFQMSEDDIARLLLNKKGVAFDTLPNHLGLTDKDVDKSSLLNFRKRMNDAIPNNIYQELNDHDFLLRIGALTEDNGKDVLRNGAVLFFGNISDILQLCPNYFLDYQENRSNQTRWDKRIVSDDYSFNANLYNFFERVSTNITLDLPNPFKTDGIKNRNGTDIRRSVIEGIVNAITNCDYTSLPGILIKKSKDNISIINSGELSIGIHQAITGGISNPYNKNIMNYFRLIQVSDRAGSGIPSIYQVFASYHFPTPELRIENEPKRTILNLSFLQLSDNVSHQEEKLKILAYLTNHVEGSTAKELSDLIQLKNTSTNQIISELLASNQIQTNGKKTKGKRYFIQK